MDAQQLSKTSTLLRLTQPQFRYNARKKRQRVKTDHLSGKKCHIAIKKWVVLVTSQQKFSFLPYQRTSDFKPQHTKKIKTHTIPTSGSQKHTHHKGKPFRIRPCVRSVSCSQEPQAR